MDLLSRKTLNKLSCRTNEVAGSQVSDFALRVMKKYGWEEGKGLGKNEDGRVKHLVVKKKEDNGGVSFFF